jgi:hypothetical protein
LYPICPARRHTGIKPLLKVGPLDVSNHYVGIS